VTPGKGKIPTIFPWGIPRIILVSSTLRISTKLGRNTWIGVCVNCFIVKFWFFSVKGSLFQKTALFVDFGWPPCHWVTTQGIHCWTFGFVLPNRGHAKDLPFFGEHFTASYRLWVINPRISYTRSREHAIQYTGTSIRVYSTMFARWTRYHLLSHRSLYSRLERRVADYCNIAHETTPLLVDKCSWFLDANWCITKLALVRSLHIITEIKKLAPKSWSAAQQFKFCWKSASRTWCSDRKGSVDLFVVRQSRRSLMHAVRVVLEYWQLA